MCVHQGGTERCKPTYVYRMPPAEVGDTQHSPYTVRNPDKVTTPRTTPRR
jgi:hypothetical protein